MKQDQQTNRKNCQRCGEHFTDQHECRARKVTCYKCQRPGHFARMCKTKNTVDYVQETSGQEEYDFDSVEFELVIISSTLFPLTKHL